MSHAILLGEFLPTPTPSRARIWLGIPLSLLVVVGVLVVAALLALPSSVRYDIARGRLETMARTGLFPSRWTVPLDAISEVKEVRLGHGRRVAGGAMPGYCAGHFVFEGLGDVSVATDCSRDVLLIRASGQGRPLLVSPADPTAFRAALASGGPASFRPAGRPPSRWVWGGRALAAVMLLTSLWLPAQFVLAPRRLRYRVFPGILEVGTLLTRRRFALAGSRARRVEPTRLLRIAGTAIPGFATGFFRLDGTTVRVYATAWRRGVLIEGGRKVYVTPADEEGFLVALRQAGAVVES